MLKIWKPRVIESWAIVGRLKNDEEKVAFANTDGFPFICCHTDREFVRNYFENGKEFFKNDPDMEWRVEKVNLMVEERVKE